MSWKHALYDFIHTRNQMEVDYNWSGLAPFVMDESILAKEQAVQERRRSQHKMRSALPKRAETRMKIRHVETAGEKIIADADLMTTLEYGLGGRNHTEYRRTFERFTLVMDNGKWKVSGQLPLVSEGGADDAKGSEETDVDLEDLAAKATAASAPFINRNLITASDLPRQIRYNRERARMYADEWWNSYNSNFIQFEVDCSNYVSQCLFAGGAPMNYTGRRAMGWWYRGKSGNQELWSYSWAVAHSLQLLLAGRRSTGLRAEEVQSAAELNIGDVISYDWNGSGRYGHSTIVTAFEPNGMPLVNAHTVNSRYRYWDYSDSYAWTEKTRYRFFHIPDIL